MAITLFVLLLIIVVPNLVKDVYIDTMTDQELLAVFASHPAYVAMSERFPDAPETLESYGRGEGSLRVGVMDFESGAQLILSMNTHRDGIVYAHVECINDNEDRRDYVEDLFAAEFIRNTDCLGPVG